MLTDKLGNQLREGQMVQVQLPHGDVLICHVEGIQQAGIIGGPSGMQVPGQVMLLSMMPVSFDPQHPMLENVVVVQVPSNQERASASTHVREQ